MGASEAATLQQKHDTKCIALAGGPAAEIHVRRARCPATLHEGERVHWYPATAAEAAQAELAAWASKLLGQAEQAAPNPTVLQTTVALPY
jgi:hypothetical protein